MIPIRQGLNHRPASNGKGRQAFCQWSSFGFSEPMHSGFRTSGFSQTANRGDKAV